ncbi:MAG: hypothetical protein KDE14_14850 [Rhodobacteraceae bacterium]|nr:hypothetical protein [Paracoccaceae bacterium]
MQWLMKLLGYMTGKTAVRCAGCAHLDNGLCYGKVKISEEDRNTPRVCGFFSARG